MENNYAMMPATLRRRRRKKNATKPNSAISNISSSDINRQDAALEREVDSYLNWGRENANKRKRQKRVYGCVEDSLPGKAKVNDNATDDKADISRGGNTDREASDISRVLPMLLHLREIGLSRRLHDKNGRRASWKSLLLHEDQHCSASSSRREDVDNNTNERYSNLARLRVPVHPSSAPNSQGNSLQYSSPTYYGIYNNNNAENLYGNIPLRRQLWRPYTQQRIPFSKLRTSFSDAILAIDRWGGYLIGVGRGDIGERGANMSKGMCPHLSIKFYGVPSPARLHQIQHYQHYHDGASQTSQTVSPLIHTVPLLFKNLGSIENRNFPAPSSILGHNEYASPAADTPMQILLSDSGSLGVVFLHHSTATAWSNNNDSAFSESPATQDEDILGTIVIFEPPSVAWGKSRLTKSFRCSNVRVGGWSSFTMRNALWPTTLIPAKKSGQHMDSKENDFHSSPYLCHLFLKYLSAYMLFNDEDDGFRITWITIGSSLDENAEVVGGEANVSPNANSSFANTIRPTRTDIVEKSDGASVRQNWEECSSDPETGYRPSDDSSQTGDCSGLNVAYEVYLRIDALLSDIISRRQSSLFKKSPYHNTFFMPEFFYNLISASPDSLKVMLVIVFSNKEKMMFSGPSALGIFAEVNLFDQSYNELKWVQHPSCNDASSMKQWCNSLALNWRMKECRVGVFCLESCKIEPQLEQWVGGTHECNVDEDLGDDFNVDLWSNYVELRAKRKGIVSAPKDISMSSLYPYCDIITNRAVHNAIPVKRMASRNSPIELIYG